MTRTFSNISDDGRANRHSILAWLLFPLSFFPLVALLTYDWRAIAALQVPPASSTNWIGALGDYFAYYGYTVFGLAIWLVPVVCVVAGLCVVAGRKMRTLRRLLSFALSLVFLSGLLQVLGAHQGPVGWMVGRLNLASPGGAIGYLLMTRLLSPLLGDFGSAVLMVTLTLVSLVAAVGARNIVALFAALFRWALTGHADARADAAPSPEDFGSHAADPSVETSNPTLDAIRAAKADAQRDRDAEKAAARNRINADLAAEHAAEKAKEKTRVRAAAKPKPEPPAEPAPDETPDGPYLLPPLSLLDPIKKSTADHGDVEALSQKLVDTLRLFDVNATLAYTVQGPVVTKYALSPEPGTRPEEFTKLQNTLMMALKAKSLRIEAPIPGEDKIGIEVPNRTSAGISFREIIESDAWRRFKGELPLLFGKDAAGNALVADLAKMPHMLVAGATGQGKSVCLNAIINGLLMTKTPDQLKLMMVDPKSVEFTSYVELPHLIVPIITDNKKVVFSLHWAVAEMEKRLKLFAQARVRNIYDYNHRPQVVQTDMFGEDGEVGKDLPRTVPYIVIIIDEVADLMASEGKQVTPDIARLTAKARAAGIHLILATQRPDAKIITGTIKANIPGRVAFKTATAVDSRTILDDGGAENLIGKGDMLFRSAEGLLIRAQGAWISDPEINNITQFIAEHSKTQFDQQFADKLSRVKEAGIADPFADNPDDPDNQPDSDAPSDAPTREQVKADEAASDFKKAVECIINYNRASVSFFQRRLGWGYNHASKIMDMLEEAGITAPQSGAGPRQIIMSQEQLLAIFNGKDGGTSAFPDEPTGTEPDAAPAAADPTEPFLEDNT